jgi:hypothetical protein
MGDSDSEVEFNMGQGDIREEEVSPSRFRNQDREIRCQNINNCCHNKRPAIIIKPDKYSGNEDWEQYFSHFQDCAELGKWTTQEKLLTLAACLRGQARAFYTTLAGHDKRSFDDLAHALEQRFGAARQQTRYVSKFQTRLKLVGESIAAFGDDLRLLARKAYSNLEPAAQETLALQQFCKALSVDMKCRVMDRDCQTIAEAVEVVERYEDLLNESNVERRRNLVRQIESSEDERVVQRQGDYERKVRWQPKNERSEDGVQRALRSIQIRLDRIEKGSLRGNNGPRRCYICRSLEHFARDCPRRYSESSSHGASSNGNESSGNGSPSTL